MDTRTNGKAHTFTGEYKDWIEWPFQLKHFAGQPWKNPVRTASVRAHDCAAHNQRLHLCAAQQCKRSAQVTVKTTKVNNGLEAWRHV